MGLDEVGRGCLAGPVVAAGVILDLNNLIEGIQWIVKNYVCLNAGVCLKK